MIENIYHYKGKEEILSLNLNKIEDYYRWTQYYYLRIVEKINEAQKLNTGTLSAYISEIEKYKEELKNWHKHILNINDEHFIIPVVKSLLNYSNLVLDYANNAHQSIIAVEQDYMEKANIFIIKASEIIQEINIEGVIFSEMYNKINQ